MRVKGVFWVMTSAILALVLPAPSLATHDPSHTATQVFWSWTQSNPYIVFDKNTISNSALIAYASYGAERYRASLRAGSGQNADECDKSTSSSDPGGWLPNGTYYPVFRYKNDAPPIGTGHPVVQGYVWELGSKYCWNGVTQRTGLFIHSSGIEGTTWDGNYQNTGLYQDLSTRPILHRWNVPPALPPGGLQQRQ